MNRRKSFKVKASKTMAAFLAAIMAFGNTSFIVGATDDVISSENYEYQNYEQQYEQYENLEEQIFIYYDQILYEWSTLHNQRAFYELSRIIPLDTSLFPNVSSSSLLAQEPIINTPFNEYTLTPGEEKTWQVPVSNLQIGNPYLDIMYVIDTTGSVHWILPEVFNGLSEFTQNLYAAGAADINFGVAYYGDYDFDLPWHGTWFGINLPLGNHEVDVVRDAINSAPILSGGSWDEDHLWGYMRAVYETTTWRDYAQRIVILVTDNVPTKIRSHQNVGGFPVTLDGARELTDLLGVQPLLMVHYGGWDFPTPVWYTSLQDVAYALDVNLHRWTSQSDLLDRLSDALIIPTYEMRDFQIEARVISTTYLSDGYTSYEVYVEIYPYNFILEAGETVDIDLTAFPAYRPNSRFGDTTIVEIGFFVDGVRVYSATQYLELYFDALFSDLFDLDASANIGGYIYEGSTENGLLPVGYEVVVVANPETFWRFTYWEAEGLYLTENQLRNPNLTFYMPYNDVTLVANFEIARVRVLIINPHNNSSHLFAKYYYKWVNGKGGKNLARPYNQNLNPIGPDGNPMIEFEMVTTYELTRKPKHKKFVDIEVLLRDENWNYRFDVIAIGSWIYGGIIRPGNETHIISAISDFMDAGGGVLFGNETLLDRHRTSHGRGTTAQTVFGSAKGTLHDGEFYLNRLKRKYGMNYLFAPLAHRAGLIPSQRVDRFASHSNTKARKFAVITEQGPLTSFPFAFEVGQIIPVSKTHNNGALATGTVWAQFVDRHNSGTMIDTTGNISGNFRLNPYRHAGGNIVVDFAGRYITEAEWGKRHAGMPYTQNAFQPAGTYQSNFFISTFENTANIQTWRDVKQITMEERMLFVNTLFYLSSNAFSNLEDISELSEEIED